MNEDKKPIFLKEVNVGTSTVPLTSADFGSAGNGQEPPLLASQRPSLPELESHRRRLHELLLPNAPALTPTTTDNAQSSDGQASLLGSVVVEAGDLHRIEQLVECLEPLERWAKEEAAHHREEVSGLAEVDAPMCVVACLLTGRPRLTTAALRVVAQLLQHPQSRDLTLRAVAGLASDAVGSGGPDTAEGDRVEGERRLPTLLATLLSRSSGLEELCVACTEVAAVLAEVPRACGSSAPVPDADAFMDGELISRVLGAVEWHADSAALLTAATRFFANVARLPRRVGVDGDDADPIRRRERPAPAPAGLLMCHIGTILDTMLAAVRGREGNTQIRCNVLDFLRICAQWPQNQELLLCKGAYALALQSLSPVGGGGANTRVGEWHAFAAAAETAQRFPALLDAYQRRRYARAVQNLLVSSSEARRVRLALAMLRTLLDAVAADLAAAARDRGSPSTPSIEAFGAYALYPQPAGTSGTIGDAVETTSATLAETEMLVALCDPYDTVAFLHDCLVPQLVSNALGHYRQELALLDDADPEEGEEEGLVMASVVSLAEQCLTLLMQPPPPPRPL